MKTITRTLSALIALTATTGGLEAKPVTCIFPKTGIVVIDVQRGKTSNVQVTINGVKHAYQSGSYFIQSEDDDAPTFAFYGGNPFGKKWDVMDRNGNGTKGVCK